MESTSQPGPRPTKATNSTNTSQITTNPRKQAAQATNPWTEEPWRALANQGRDQKEQHIQQIPARLQQSSEGSQQNQQILHLSSNVEALTSQAWTQQKQQIQQIPSKKQQIQDSRQQKQQMP